MAKKKWRKPRYLNPAARKEHIKEQGCKCIICGFDFGETYGSQFDGEIHVHHVNPLHLQQSE
jgi:5-methylcytosine-specific restriction protein A